MKRTRPTATVARLILWSAVALIAMLGTSVFGEDAPKKRAPKICHINPEKLAVIMGSDATLTGELRELYPGKEWKRFWVENWRQTSDRFDWTVECPREGDYTVALILKDDTRAGDQCEIELAAGNRKLTHLIKRDRFWNWHVMEETFYLPVGRSILTL